MVELGEVVLDLVHLIINCVAYTLGDTFGHTLSNTLSHTFSDSLGKGSKRLTVYRHFCSVVFGHQLTIWLPNVLKKLVRQGVGEGWGRGWGGDNT